ncbi:MAG: carbohydrate ABC transporter permease [Oscillospiraceae bacterium]|jgi:multiple sugar transport system permease protein|nr:carbohydrate ABC transporter permease [Oscillospiraceae bacterium]
MRRNLYSRPLFALKLAVLVAIGIVMAFPFVWMALSALKTKQELLDFSVFFPKDAQWGNYAEVLLRSPIPRYIANSVFVAAVTVAYQMFSGALLVYAVVFMEFRFRRVIFAVVLGCYMVPGAATYIPSYILLSKMGLLDSYTGLIVSNLVSIFGVFLLRQAFMQVPPELYDAARMDGAGHWKTLWRVIFPLTRPMFISFALIAFITCYNNYMWPSLITNSPELSLVSQGLRHFFIEGGAYGTNWAVVMAASTLVTAPLLIMSLLIQKRFIAGIGADTGVKG